MLVSYGIGQGLGTLVAGWIFNGIMTGDAQRDLALWRTCWTAPLLFAVGVTVAFVLLFREDANLLASPRVASTG